MKNITKTIILAVAVAALATLLLNKKYILSKFITIISVF